MTNNNRVSNSIYLLILLLLINLVSIFFAVDFPQILHFSELIIIGYSLYEFLFKKKSLSLILYAYLILIITVSIQSFLKNDFKSTIFIISNVLTLYTFEFFWRDKKLNINILLEYVFLSTIPVCIIFILFPTIPIQYGEWMQDQTIQLGFYERLIPNLNNDFGINIGAPNQSKHHTGFIGLILLIYCLFKKKVRFKVLSIPILLFSLYLIGFSKSRSFVVAGFLCLTIFYLNKRNFYPLITTIILIAAASITYMTEIIVDFIIRLQPLGIDFLIKYLTNDYVNQDISSGRLWLQTVHLSYFSENILLGAHSDKLFFFEKDITEWGIAQAGSESFYTQLLARFGIFGLFYIFFHIRFWYLGIKTKSIFKLVISGCIIYLTATNSTFQNTYGFESTIFFSLLFSKVSF